MRRKIGTVAIAAVIGFSGFFSTGLSDKATANTEMQQRLNDVKNERSNIEANKTDKEKEVEKLQTDQQKLAAEIEQLDSEVAETKKQITAKKQEIDDTRNDIKKLQDEIKVLKERIEKRNELLKDRARSFQQGGGAVNYLDVLLGAQSFGDFIDRVGAVATIVQADRDILQAHQNDLIELEEKELELREKLASLEQHLVDLENMEAKLKSKIAENNKKKAALKKQETAAMHEIHELENEAEILAAQEKAIQAEIRAYEERKKREEEERRKAEEAAAKAAAAAAAGKPSSSSPSPSHVSSPPPVSSGNWTRPATGSVTSGFGTRWGGNHFGIDIGKNGRSGDVPVVAAASGTVFQSYHSSSYGNVVFITHYIDGQTWTTVYAHLASPGLAAGTSVSKGQQIGVMGNTGTSTGPHLHFELHKGSWNGSKSNAVNPASYINF